jgi:hypothetical protein
MADPRSEELKASMGEKSTYHTGGPTPAAPAPKPELTDEHKTALVEHLKTLLGVTHTPVMGEANPANAESVAEAVNQGLSKVPKIPAEE